MKYTFTVKLKGSYYPVSTASYWMTYEIATTAGTERAARDQIDMLLSGELMVQFVDLIDFEEEERR